MGFNRKTNFGFQLIKGLEDGGTYVMEFSEDMSPEECQLMISSINNYLKKHNRDICFIYMRKGAIEIKGAKDYGI